MINLRYTISGLAVIVPTLFTMCAPMYGDRSKNFDFSSKLKTFYQLSAEFGLNNNEGGGVHTLRDVNLKPEVVKQCPMGELDIVAAARTCGINAPFIVTVKDRVTELLGYRFDAAQSANLDTLTAQLTLERIVANVAGDKIDIFACLDSNNNGLCGDEPILDINALTAQLVADDKAAVCNQIKNGILLFHSQGLVANFSGTLYVTATSDPAAQAVSLSLRNLSSLNENNPVPPTTTGPTAGMPTFPMKLARHDHCPAPVVRMDGCFVEGTQIEVAQGVNRPIEKLRAGQNVRLANGQYATIERLVAGPEPEPVVEIETSFGQRITVTSEHPLMTTAGMQLAKGLRLGQQLLDAHGRAAAIVFMRKRDYDRQVYNFEVLSTSQNVADHTVIANGLQSGDLYLQNKISKSAQPIAPHTLSLAK